MIAYLIPAKEDDYPSLYKQINSNYLEYILPRNKLSVTQARDIYNRELLPDFKINGINLVVCFDAVFYQAIYKACKPSVEIGYIRTTPEVKITYLPSMSNMFYFPEETKEDYDFGIKQINNYLAGKYSEPGNIIHKGIYPNSYLGIKDTLCELLKYDRLTCDIETFSLKHPTAGLASISFAWNEHEGVAFLVDDRFTKERNTCVRILLKDFFEAYKGKLIFHNISFDATVLIYQLWMKYITDTKGLLEGLSVMLNNFDDTKILTYLATNNCTANHLSLKEQSKHFAGNYAQENITDLTLIPTKELLEYNLKDTLSTWFVFNKWNDKVDTDKQRNIYETLFKPALVDIIQMQLTGLPINMPRVLEVKKELTSHRDKALATIMNNRYVISFTVKLNKLWVENRNKVLKKKKVTLADAKEVFNPNSSLQLRELFYDTLGLPVLSTTKKKEPSTDAATLEKLLNHTNDDKVKELIKALLDYFAVDKILTTFIPAFEEAFYSKEDNWHYIFGNFNLGGTVSGRLSSSKPNLQQIPATGSKYAKIIKSCFSAPPGWLFVGLDFASLEDRISTLTTKDPNKIAVYEHGYDGHCLRAFTYFKEEMPDIQAQLDEIHKEGKVYKVTKDDGSVEYLNEFNPKLKEYRNESN